MGPLVDFRRPRSDLPLRDGRQDWPEDLAKGPGHGARRRAVEVTVTVATGGHRRPGRRDAPRGRDAPGGLDAPGGRAPQGPAGSARRRRGRSRGPGPPDRHRPAPPVDGTTQRLGRAFREYARSGIWTYVHVGQYLCALLIVMSLLALARRLSRQDSLAGVLALVGGVMAVMVAVVFTVQMAVDGVALRSAVHAWVTAAPGAATVSAFGVAEAVRSLEKGLSGFFLLNDGFTLLALGLAIALGHRYARWLGWAGAVAGVAFLVGGVVTASTGFLPRVGSVPGTSVDPACRLCGRCMHLHVAGRRPPLRPGALGHGPWLPRAPATGGVGDMGGLPRRPRRPRGQEGKGVLRALSSPYPEPMDLEFSGEIWFWRGPAPWHFVTVPDEHCHGCTPRPRWSATGGG